MVEHRRFHASLMSSLLKKYAQEELNRRKQTGVGKIAKLKGLLSAKQLSFVDDTNRFKLARCSRRAGKTLADAVYLIIECLQAPKTPTLYVGLTRDSAKAAIWDILLTILHELEIPHESLASVLKITFHNGSFIQLFGADATNARNRLRGRKFKLIIPDEMGFYAEADGLIKSMIPMLADLQGTLAMTSSPGELLSGLFYEADEGADKANWSRHSWSLLENPLFMGPAKDPKFPSRGHEELDTICRLQFNGNRMHPAFRREFLGQWVADKTSLVYPCGAHNIIERPIDAPDAMYGLGLDLGVRSDNAITIVKYSHYSRTVQIVDCFKKSELLVDELAVVIQEYIDLYAPTYMVADTGGMGVVFVEEFRKKYHMPFIAADKKEKKYFQRVVANDLLAGYIKVVQGLDIINEWKILTKNVDTGEEESGENHLSDSFLYIYRKLHSTHLKHFEPPKSEEEKMIDSVKNSLQKSDSIMDLGSESSNIY